MLITKETIIQELNHQLADFTETYDLYAGQMLWALPWRAEAVIDRYIGALSYGFRRYINEVPLSELIEKIAEEFTNPVFTDEKYGIKFYRHIRFNLSNCTDNSSLDTFYFTESDADVVDAYTGEIIPPETRVVKYEDGYTQITNLDSSFFVCRDCGRLLTSTEIDYYGDYYRVCVECYEKGGWAICDHCGETVPDDGTYSVYTRNGEEYWCESCLDYTFRCDDCGDYYSEDDFSAIETVYGDYICPDCAENEYQICDNCGHAVPEGDGYYDDDDDTFLCEACHRREENRFVHFIESYHSHHNNYNMSFGEGKKRIGTELEVEGAGKSAKELNEMAGLIIKMFTDEYGHTHLYCENDGSLNCGFENITNPHTVEEYYKLPIKEMLQTLSDNGYTSHNNGRCGLHIHFSNEWFGDTWEEIDDNVSKVVHFYSANYETLFKLSRRTESNAHWARRFAVNDFEDAKTAKCDSVGHGTAVNLQNMNTIHTVEFRLGRGTLNYESYMAWLDIHIAIVKNSRIVPKGNTDLNEWLYGIKEETKEYIKRRADIEIVDVEREVA